MTARWFIIFSLLVLIGCDVRADQINACAVSCGYGGRALRLCSQKECVCGDAPDAGAPK